MRFIGMMVCGQGEGDKQLKRVLDQWKGIVDDAIICQNNTDKKTQTIIKKSGYWTYHDDREWGYYQPQIKTELLKRVIKLKPDWIFPKDADEVYGKHFTREAAEKLGSIEKQISWNFYFIQLWNDEQHCHRGLGFWNVRMFKHYPRLGTDYLAKPLHCGLAPPAFYRFASNAPFLMLHYGLMSTQDRQRKVKRYQKYDPNAKYKGKEYYDAIAKDVTGSLFDEEEWHQRVAEDCKKYPAGARNF